MGGKVKKVLSAVREINELIRTLTTYLGLVHEFKHYGYENVKKRCFRFNGKGQAGIL
jgi:hypothetical protein